MAKEHLELRWIRPDGREAASSHITFSTAEAAMDAYDAAMQVLSQHPKKPHRLTFGAEVPDGYSARCEECGTNFKDAVQWLMVACR